MKAKRVFLIVLDSFGIGELPDADDYGDAGSNTLGAIAADPAFAMPNMAKLGFFNIDGVRCGHPEAHPLGSFARMAELSRGKDTTIGHWEIAGVYSPKPLPTFPQGFPQDFLAAFSAKTGRGVLCNRPYSGTEVIRDYGREQERTGSLIVYTSADSVFQIAAHERIVPVQELYDDCRIARGMLTGPLGVGRVIARPFTGESPDYVRTSGRHDFSLEPPEKTMLDRIAAQGLGVIAVGKIRDIFAGRGVTRAEPTAGNADGMERTLRLAREDFTGLCFVNLVDFDMLYGHRNDVRGYASAASAFDRFLPGFLREMREDDLLMITADHGCDPSTPSTDHSREYTPLVLFGHGIRPGVNLGTRPTFSDIAATVLDALGVPAGKRGESLLPSLAADADAR